MVARHISMRGSVIDMERMRLANGDAVALGNASKNARGDQIGPRGVVLKTQEQIEAEWAANKAKREAETRPVDLKADDALARALANLAPKGKTAIMQEDQGFDPSPIETATPEVPRATPQPGTRRTTIESD